MYCTACMNNSRKHKTISFFNYPHDEARRNEWLRVVDRADLIDICMEDKKRQQYRICEDHFDKSNIKLSKNKMIKYLYPNAFPTLNLRRTNHTQCTSSNDTASSSKEVQGNPVRPAGNEEKPGTVYKSTWFGYNEMSFMLDKYTNNEQKTTESNPEPVYENEAWDSNVSTEVNPNLKAQLTSEIHIKNEFSDITAKIEPLSDQDDFEYTDDIDTNLINTSLSEPNTTEPGPSSQINTMPANEKNTSWHRPSSQLSENPIDQFKMEDVATFCNFIQSKLKKYPEEILNEVQRDIYEIIYKADKDYYKNQLDSSFNLKSGPSKRKRIDSDASNSNPDNRGDTFHFAEN